MVTHMNGKDSLPLSDIFKSFKRTQVEIVGEEIINNITLTNPKLQKYTQKYYSGVQWTKLRQIEKYNCMNSYIEE